MPQRFAILILKGEEVIFDFLIQTEDKVQKNTFTYSTVLSL
jgi:hypothetical protein